MLCSDPLASERERQAAAQGRHLFACFACLTAPAPAHDVALAWRVYVERGGDGRCAGH